MFDNNNNNNNSSSDIPITTNNDDNNEETHHNYFYSNNIKTNNNTLIHYKDFLPWSPANDNFLKSNSHSDNNFISNNGANLAINVCDSLWEKSENFTKIVERASDWLAKSDGAIQLKSCETITWMTDDEKKMVDTGSGMALVGSRSLEEGKSTYFARGLRLWYSCSSEINSSTAITIPTNTNNNNINNNNNMKIKTNKRQQQQQQQQQQRHVTLYHTDVIPEKFERIQDLVVRMNKKINNKNVKGKIISMETVNVPLRHNHPQCHVTKWSEEVKVDSCQVQILRVYLLKESDKQQTLYAEQPQQLHKLNIGIKDFLPQKTKSGYEPFEMFLKRLNDFLKQDNIENIKTATTAATTDDTTASNTTTTTTAANTSGDDNVLIIVCNLQSLLVQKIQDPRNESGPISYFTIPGISNSNNDENQQQPQQQSNSNHVTYTLNHVSNNNNNAFINSINMDDNDFRSRSVEIFRILRLYYFTEKQSKKSSKSQNASNKKSKKAAKTSIADGQIGKIRTIKVQYPFDSVTYESFIPEMVHHSDVIICIGDCQVNQGDGDTVDGVSKSCKCFGGSFETIDVLMKRIADFLRVYAHEVVSVETVINPMSLYYPEYQHQQQTRQQQQHQQQQQQLYLYTIRLYLTQQQQQMNNISDQQDKENLTLLPKQQPQTSTVDQQQEKEQLLQQQQQQQQQGAIFLGNVVTRQFKYRWLALAISAFTCMAVIVTVSVVYSNR
ncbi:hypothetical protein HELRODRAFT_165596 [Helobdella robusta]|uniref:Uncharacterized protein n=1 Tax=Helobdella robusta TaxID=6412 RepID=T1EX21_HELRO|nr:hypothetical protein HELRODRAFT_165596 [Helobdella robusta]ESN91543.1 hypothetical protein HELRODRAFT_165596 [Helobdella robusta]